MQCDYYDAGRCRSCTLIERPYRTQLAAKDARARTALAPFARELDWDEPIASAESGFRNKAKMVVGGTLSSPRLGILGPGRQVVDLRECGLHEPAIVAALPVLAEFITTARLTPYEVASRRGELKYVLVTAAPSGALMVRFVLRSTEALPRIRKHLPTLQQHLPELTVASVNIQPAAAAIIEGDQEILLTDQGTLPMHLGELRLHLGPRSFFQTNTAMARRLYQQAQAWTAGLGASTIWDLYCGVGGFALHLAQCAGPAPSAHSGSTHSALSPSGTSPRPRPPQITGIEVSEQAIASARRSAARAGLEETVRFAVGDATEFAASRRHDPDRPDPGLPRDPDLPHDPDLHAPDLHAPDLSHDPDLVVVNPPRRGIGDRLANWLQEGDTAHVLYSSCNVDSLAKDLARMPSLRPVHAQVLDMFPQTGHFETLMLLERR